MAELSIGDAWERTAALVQRESRLLLPVALLFVALPNAAFQLFFPTEMIFAQLKTQQYPPWLMLVVVPFLVIVVGTLALTALALVPRISVGEALVTALRRFPVLFGARLIFGLGFGFLGSVAITVFSVNRPVGALLCLALLPAALFVAVRLVLLETVVVAQAVGPIDALRQSWRLTAGHFWRLLGFLVVFTIGNLVLSMAAGMVAKLLAVVLDKGLGSAAIGELLSALIVGIVSAVTTTIVAVMVAMLYRQRMPENVAAVFS